MQGAGTATVLVTDLVGSIPYNWRWLTAMCNRAEESSWFRDRATAEGLLEQLAPFSNHFSMTLAPTGAVVHFVGALSGALERFDDADVYFVEAVAMEVRSGSLACLADEALPTVERRARELLAGA